ASRSEGAAGWVAGAAGLETLPGFPLQSSAWGAAELCSARTIARGRAQRGGGRAGGRCRGFGNPPRVSITIVGSRRASPFGDFGTYTSNPCPRSLRSRPRARRGPSRAAERSEGAAGGVAGAAGLSRRREAGGKAGWVAGVEGRDKPLQYRHRAECPDPSRVKQPLTRLAALGGPRRAGRGVFGEG